MSTRWRSVGFFFLANLLVTASCAPQSENPLADLRTLPEKTEQPTTLTPTGPLISGPSGGARQTAVRAGPAPPGAPETAIRMEPSIALSGEPANLTIEQMPLPAFINTVFGDTLHLTFEIDPKIAQRADPVTLRTGRRLQPNEILALARAVLRDYGISVVVGANLARIVPDEALLSQSPNVIRGRSTTAIAESLRPIYQYLPLANVSANDMAGWLQNAFGTKVRVSPAPQANALLLLGLPDDIQAANEAIRTLDQPRLAGRRSVRIEPVFWSVGQLADKLADILRAEGYNVSTTLQNPGALVILPLRPNNSIVVFAADQKALSHVVDWSRDLDQVAQVDPQRSLFYYGVRNTTAESLANVLNTVLQGRNAERSTAAAGPEPGPPGAPPGFPGIPPPGAGPPPGPGGAPAGPAPGSLPARIVTDAPRNAIIFQGSAEEFAQLRPLIESLDQAAREAIIEVTVAEVTLNNNETLGTEWILNLGAGPNGQGALDAKAPGTQRRRGPDSGGRAGADRDQPRNQLAASGARNQRDPAEHTISGYRGDPDRQADDIRRKSGRPRNQTGGQRSRSEQHFRAQHPGHQQSYRQHSALAAGRNNGIARRLDHGKRQQHIGWDTGAEGHSGGGFSVRYATGEQNPQRTLCLYHTLHHELGRRCGAANRNIPKAL